jgi:malate dehydrogenase (oxaloacetate-decarboxylating)
MLVAAVKALAAESPALKDDKTKDDKTRDDEVKGLLPDVQQARELSVKIAMAVIRAAVGEGLAREKCIPERDEGEDGLEAWVRAQMWEARYRELKRV